MKRILSLVLALVLCLALLGGCGTSEPADPVEPVSPAAPVEPAEPTEPAEPLSPGGKLDAPDGNEPEQNEPGEDNPPVEPVTPVEPAVPAPQLHDVPYTAALAADTGIYSAPGGSYLQDIGQNGVFTITEETVDEQGNLWGKLKSGAGWVLIEAVEGDAVLAQVCTSCGGTPPAVSFSFGRDICDLCAYYAQVEVVRCPRCGADCSFRGLEENGLCEDCNSYDAQVDTVYCPSCGSDCSFRGLEENGLCEDCNSYYAQVESVYCRNCGADCSFRGLEGDGLCEDCYYAG